MDPLRRYHRFQVDLRITMASASHFWTGTTLNASEGGVFVASKELKPIGTEVEMTITLPDPHPPLWVVGIVRWIRETSSEEAPLGMGIQFRMISEEALRSIRHFFWKRPPIIVE